MTVVDDIMPLAATAAEVADTPAAIGRALARLADPVAGLAAALTAHGITRLIITGSGDSLSAGHMAAPAFAAYAGIPCQAVPAHELVAYGHPDLGPGTAVAVVSSSGRPGPAHDALDRARHSGAFVIGISDRDTPGNPFLAVSAGSLCPGAAKAGIPTQATSATLATLFLLAIDWGGARTPAGVRAQLAAMPTLLEQVRHRGRDAAGTLGVTLPRHRMLHIVGAGPNAGTAHAVADLLTAAAALAALPHEAEEFQHALRPWALGRDDLVLALVPPGARTAPRLLDAIRVAEAAGARAVTLGGPDHPLPVVDEFLSPLPLLMLAQEMTLAAGDAVAQAGSGFRTSSSQARLP
ncbi:MAG: SIS domain-containing protein [Azospirillaceae bacterium]|nr:SIS domain-containing protein [Azospirillaceae bacterium]